MRPSLASSTPLADMLANDDVCSISVSILTELNLPRVSALEKIPS